MQNKRLVELAIIGLEAEKARIEKDLAELRSTATLARRTSRIQPGAAREAEQAGKSQRRMSAAARRKISEAMKKSHAERKAAALRASKSR
jgi:hypothetical protein